MKRANPDLTELQKPESCYIQNQNQEQTSPRIHFNNVFRVWKVCFHEYFSHSLIQTINFF